MIAWYGKPHIKSGLVPVMAKDDEEEWHGMWVGQDCAKKFMGFMRFTIPADSCKGMQRNWSSQSSQRGIPNSITDRRGGPW